MSIAYEKKSISKSVRLTESACKEIEKARGQNFSEQLLNLIYSYVDEKKELESNKARLIKENEKLNREIQRKRYVLVQLRKVDSFLSQFINEIE